MKLFKENALIFLALLFLFILHACEVEGSCNDVYISLTNDYNEFKKKPNGTPLLNNYVSRRIVLVNDNEDEYYTFVKAITLPLNNTNDIKETLFYRTDDPARKNFDKADSCNKQGLESNGVCWVYTWQPKQLKGNDPLPGDYDIWVHVYYAPSKCGAFTCHMDMSKMYECTIRKPISIDNY